MSCVGRYDLHAVPASANTGGRNSRDTHVAHDTQRSVEPMLSKKHYESIAAVIASRVKTLEHPEVEGYFEDGSAFDEVESIANELADYFATDNPAKFDRARFLRACGVSQ